MQHDYYYIQEWKPELKRKAEDLIKKIHDVAPELEVLFMGAAALGLPGKNDLDLDILCDQHDLKRYVHVIMSVLGTPKELNEVMAIWSYEDEGIEIDCILSDDKRTGSHVPKQKAIFEKLKASPELQERYRKLKYEWSGLPYEQYETKKKEFLKEVEDL